jgi:hypothetical protein
VNLFFLVKVTVKFIRRGAGGRQEREKQFLFPIQEMGAKTQNGGHQLLGLYWRAGKIHWSRIMGLGG